MKRHLWVLTAVLMSLWLSGCATTAPPAEPRELIFETPPELTLETAVALLMERGYVIRHADGELGRVEAVLARWPGYNVQLSVQGEDDTSRVSVSATRGGRPLAPQTLDPLLVDLRSRLGLFL
jgi:hypothetical protein